MVSGYGAFRSAYIFSAAGPRIRARLYRVSSLTLRGNGGRAAFVYVPGSVFFRPIDRDVSRERSSTISDGVYRQVAPKELQLIKVGN